MSSYLKPISPLHKERLAYIFLNYGRLDVKNGAFVLEDLNGTRAQIPVATFSVIFLEPGTVITHAAAWLAAQCHTLICFVGEGATRCYSLGRASDGNTDNLLKQVRAFSSEAFRLTVVRNMYAIRFGSEPPSRRSLEQLRGIEGARVREAYKRIAKESGVEWQGRNYKTSDWDSADPLNRALSASTAALHGVAEAVIVACGFSPALGFIHTGAPRSFVFDLADLYKLELCVPLAFKIVKESPDDVERRVRHALRDAIKKLKIIDRMTKDLDLMFEGAQ